MEDTKVLLSVRGLKKYFPVKSKGLFSREKRYLRANENVSFDIREGETFALVGESGSGKSTLGKTLLGLYRPTAGEVVYYGGGEAVDLAKLTQKRLRPLRKDLQIVFQDPYSSLDPRMTVGQLVEEGVLTHKFFKRGSAELKAYVLDVMKKCGLREDMLHRYPHQFSGGQRQRVCIARALAVKPKFVVCDECVSALDASVQSQILNLLSELKEKEKLTYLFITHDLGVVRHIADRVAVTYLGEIVETGATETLFSEPRHPYTIALLSAMPTTETHPTGKKILLSGNMPSPVSPPSGCKFHTRCFMARDICRREAPPFTETEKGHCSLCHFAEMRAAEKRSLAERQGRENG